MTDQTRNDPRTAVDRDNLSDETVHDEHPTEPAEGAREPGDQGESDLREHPEEPAEGRTDIDR